MPTRRSSSRCRRTAPAACRLLNSLRRWNSGLQGDFLARYARHVELGISILSPVCATRTRAARPSWPHHLPPWAHHSTSIPCMPPPEREAVLRESQDTGLEGRRLRFGMIRSALLLSRTTGALPPCCTHETKCTSTFRVTRRGRCRPQRLLPQPADAYETLSRPGDQG